MGNQLCSYYNKDRNEERSEKSELLKVPPNINRISILKRKKNQTARPKVQTKKNIQKNGDVCISILHEPGDDRWGYEKASERWLPVHTVETILVSVISMLADPNDESPANVDAAKEWRENYPEFKRKVAKCVRKSQEELL